MRAARWVTGWARAEIRGVRPEKVLQGLAERGIVFWDADPPREHCLQLSLATRHLRLLLPLAEALGCEAALLREHGLPRLLRRLWGRRALLVCLLLAAGLLFLGRLCIWEVEVTGLETVAETELRAALADSGVDVGQSWLGLSQDAVRNRLLLRLPELRWLTVNIEGCRAVVIVRETREPETPVDEGEWADIEAAKAGIVTELRALRGTAAVGKNATVLPGDLLIEGIDTGRYETHGATRAIGTVRARTWYELSAAAPAVQTVKTQERLLRTRWALVFGKWRINFYQGCSICPGDCAKMTGETEWSIPGLLSLPIALLCERVYGCETAPQEACELREELEALLAEELRRQIGPEGVVSAESYTASRDGDLLRVLLRAECEEPIGVTVPLTEEQISARQPETKDSEE